MKTGRKILVTTAGIVVLAGCEYQSSFSLVPAAFDGGKGSDATGSKPNNPVAPTCYDERFVQPEAQVDQKIDILFVSDTSGSLSEERVAIASGIDSFIAGLPANADFRLALLPAHGPNSAHYGRLLKRGNESRVLNSTTQSLAAIRADFLYKNGANLSDPTTDGGEIGLLSVIAATTGARLDAARSACFFRPDAALAVVFVSDENDICAVYPAGITPVPDGENIENPANQAFCKNAQGQRIVSQQIVYDHLRAFMGSRPMLLSSIAYQPGLPYPHVGENEAGYGLNDLVDIAVSRQGTGVKVNLAAGNFGAALAEIGRLSTRVMNLLTTFTLAHTGVNAASLRATVDGSLVASSFDAGNNAAVIPESGQALSVIDVHYCLEQ